MSAEPKEVPMQTRSKTLPEHTREALVDLAQLQGADEAQAQDLERQAAAIRQRSQARFQRHVNAIAKDLQIPVGVRLQFEPADQARPERVTWREPAPAPAAAKPEEPPVATAPAPSPAPSESPAAAAEKPAETTRKRGKRAPALVPSASQEPTPQAAAG